MAVKLPPDTWISQVLTLKGTRDNVYSKIDGSLVGYVKDGKFVQTIDELPKLDPKKKPVQDKKFAANIKKISALNAIPSLEQDAAYYKEQAENVNNTPEERATAKAQYEALNLQVEAKRKEAGQAATVVEEEQGKSAATSAKGRLPEIQSEFAKLKEQYDILLDPFDPDGKGPTIKKKLDTLAQEYAQTYPKATGTPVISKTVAFARLAGNKGTQTPIAQATTTIQTGPTGTQAQAPAPTPAPTLTTTPKPKVTTGGTTGETTGGTTGGTTAGITPITGTGQAAPSTFNVGTFRAADEASMAKATGITPGSTVAKYDALLAKVQADYSLPDIIFGNVKSLGNILDKYVNGKIDLDQFKQEVAKDPWYRQNSTEIKARYLQKFNYDDLVKSGQAKGTTDYEMQIAKITRNLQAKARELGSAIDEGQAKLIAEDLYIHNQDADEAVIARRLATGIRPIGGMIAGKITEDYSGQALQNYQGLQALAKQNGFKLEDILPRDAAGKPMTAQGTLQSLALGELDPTRIAQDVRKLAAIGQPQFVRDLLGQGINLEDIYAPYKRTMATTLELDPGQIDLNDPTLRMAITEKGDMNLYDYTKMLRQDSRWQYTGNAREKVADSALTVLRNFGFQG
jgi:hypothetical protein